MTFFNRNERKVETLIDCNNIVDRVVNVKSVFSDETELENVDNR